MANRESQMAAANQQDESGEQTAFDLDVSRLFDLSGKVALVTGGSRGIGRALATGLAIYGADVAIAGLSRETEETVRKIEDIGRRGLFVPTDVSSVRQCRDGVRDVLKKFKKINILVNNAGVSGMSPAEKVDEDEWDLINSVNLKGVFFMSQAVARSMIENGRGGRIINIASIFGIVGSELGASVYHASKGGVVNLTRALACEWARHGILVNCIGPGFIVTHMTEDIRKDVDLEHAIENRHALGRFGRTEEMIGSVIYLASDASTFVTGQNIFVDGGYTAW